MIENVMKQKEYHRKLAEVGAKAIWSNDKTKRYQVWLGNRVVAENMGWDDLYENCDDIVAFIKSEKSGMYAKSEV